MQLEEVGKITIVSMKEKSLVINIEYKDDRDISYKVKLPIEVASKYKIDVNDHVDKDLWNVILNESKKIDIKNYIVKNYVSKILSIQDIKFKCYKKFKDYALVDESIQELINSKFLDDSSYMNEYFSYLNSELYGKYFILNYFKKNGVDEKLISNLKFNDKDEYNKAVAYVNNKIKRANSSNFMKSKVKIYNKLLSRGFNQSVIIEVLKKLNINEEDEIASLKKDLNKILNKKKKNKELSRRDIIKLLISKGYSLSRILEVLDDESSENKEIKDD